MFSPETLFWLKSNSPIISVFLLSGLVLILIGTLINSIVNARASKKDYLLLTQAISGFTDVKIRPAVDLIKSDCPIIQGQCLEKGCTFFDEFYCTLGRRFLKREN